jgi:hypothetical protein
VFTGLKGIFVPVEETESFEALVNGDLDHVPEQAFFCRWRRVGAGQGEGAGVVVEARIVSRGLTESVLAKAKELES